MMPKGTRFCERIDSDCSSNPKTVNRGMLSVAMESPGRDALTPLPSVEDLTYLRDVSAFLGDSQVVVRHGGQCSGVRDEKERNRDSGEDRDDAGERRGNREQQVEE